MQKAIQKLALNVSFSFLAAFCCFAQTSGNKSALAQIAGDWRGHSVCAVKDGPCHDEVNVYHISEVAGKSGAFAIAGNKIVDGKEVAMGTWEWKYDPETHSLQSETSNAIFRLVINGKHMEGSITLKGNSLLIRRIYLNKDN